MKTFVLPVTICFGLLMLLSFSPSALEARPPEVKNVGPAEAMQIMKQNPNTLLLDVRTLDEYREGHLANSVLIPVSQIKLLAAKKLPDRDAPLLVYCLSGARSNYASQALRKMGYTNVTNMTGGIAAWQALGLPIVR